MKRILIILLLLCMPFAADAQKRVQKMADQQTAGWRYETELMNIGSSSGSVVIKVWSFSENPNIAAEQARKNAVHGAIFKGIPGTDRIPGREPLVTDPAKEAEFAEFFNAFFSNGGDYGRFVTLTNNGAIAAGDVMRIDRKEYKVGVVVTVAYDELRRHLQETGLVKRLDSGF